MHRTPSPRSSMRWLLFVSAFLLTAAFRYLTLGEGFPNDHFVYITGGWQMGFGEWPTRDWVDPGLPLMFAASAGAQALFGPSLVGEAVLVSVAFGLAAAFTAAAVLELTGSLRIALIATLLEIAVFPRTYGYPKVLVYALAFLWFVRYVSRPGIGRAAMLACTVVIAFLFRHDHGLFLGVGGALTVLLAPNVGGWRAKLRDVVTFGGVGLVLVLPYLVYVQVHGGLASYLRAGVDFSQREAARQWHIWPLVFGDPEPFASALVYEFYAIPLVALVVLVALRRHARFSVFVAQVVPVAVVAAMANYNFIRDPLNTRLPDAIVPALMLGAWLASRAVAASNRRRVWVGLSAVALALFSISVATAGDLRGNLDRSDVRTEWNHLPRLFADRTASLRGRFSVGQIPTRVTASLVPFFGYVDRCTTSDHRLIVGGFLVELPFFAQRRFAAGQPYFGGSFGGDEGQRLALRRLRGQVVPFAVLPSDYTGDFESRFPLIADYLRARYSLLTEVPVSDEMTAMILVDSTLPALRLDAATGWPCFVP